MGTFNKMEIGFQCNFCRNVIYLEATEAQWAEFHSPNRRHVQSIFPEFTAGQRELLISGICEKCFDDMFGQFDDED